MKLLRRVGKVEKAVAAGKSSRPIALVYTADNERLPDGRELAEGEHVATDVYVRERNDFFADGQPDRYKIVERVTSAPADWGVVRWEQGPPVVIGRVCRPSEGSFIDIEWLDGHEPAVPDRVREHYEGKG
jgi:hypothetical protein